MRVTFLGTGGSSGTPGVLQGWGACDPSNPKNRRLRPSVLVETATTSILVDTSPDFREQCLQSGLKKLDAVLFTHAHADHLHGIDDLRAINRLIDAALPAYADHETIQSIKHRFGYVFEPLNPQATFYYKPTLDAHELHDGDHFEVGDMTITCFRQDHGYSHSMGFRLGDLGYCTDVVAIPDHGFEILKGVSTLIVGSFREEPHETHAHVNRALSWIERVQPEKGFLTHLSAEVDHDTLEAKLPRGVRLAYDGLVIDA
ncbi:MBL fold metallo-hydrolase [Magnetospira sp. QH-2]|uniref:MBL fold metallo-hydrolase n=1 Tax=Magnetospira sp. (strain QH-2) TaxID=1288970 RepID=UPI0003E812B8|nr:MBL fold metallo-hydrolase [Magnetospira sp. QH-2]CCQ73788.1 Putative metal-dependent hydrolase of the beta-lactamase superfamily I [Magnetospira sp. QH-2]